MALMTDDGKLVAFLPKQPDRLERAGAAAGVK